MEDLTEYINKPSTLTKIEFGVATILLIFSILLLDSSDASVAHRLFDEAGIPFEYYSNFFYPRVIVFATVYLTFLLVNFVVVPQLLRREAVVRNVLLVVVAYVVAGLVFGTTDTYAATYLFREYPTEQDTYNALFQQGFGGAFQLLVFLGAYSLVKYMAMRFVPQPLTITPGNRPLVREAALAFGVWLVTVLLLMAVGAEEMILYGAMLVPLTAAFYFFAYYYLIPRLTTKRRPVRVYILWVLLCLLILFGPVMLLVLIFCNDPDVAAGFAFFNEGFQLFITAPLAWILYKRRAKATQEIGVLQTELGQSTANLDFLRSQINPHFLFNTLNTLYGTALQENSERTAQGIQMLGDMMRFMLHENHQRQILLTREVEYMRNYIELQSLRTSTSPNISIETIIEDVQAERWIAPMLLIPFVENAFKHGISLKRKSWIRITLHYEADKLYFDVYNSTHPKHELDLEKDQSGVGLENVRQRLALLYPGKHELAIRQTPQEFFVHLTLQLGGSVQ
jgi:hypothetical protein